MRFICDATVGRLARYLRMFGFDTALIYSLQTPEESQITPDPPTLLTRNRKPISYRPLRIIKADTAEDQVEEISDLLAPHLHEDLFMTRCLACNGLLRRAARADVEGLVPEYIFHHHESFTLCPVCGKIYWEGTHTEKMRELIGGLLTDETTKDRSK